MKISSYSPCHPAIHASKAAAVLGPGISADPVITASLPTVLQAPCVHWCHDHGRSCAVYTPPPPRPEAGEAELPRGAGLRRGGGWCGARPLEAATASGQWSQHCQVARSWAALRGTRHSPAHTGTGTITGTGTRNAGIVSLYHTILQFYYH